MRLIHISRLDAADIMGHPVEMKEGRYSKATEIIKGNQELRKVLSKIEKIDLLNVAA